MKKSFLLIILVISQLFVLTHLSAIFYTIGEGTNVNPGNGSPTPYGTQYSFFRQQYLYQGNSTYNGYIRTVGFNVSSLNNCSSVQHYAIRLKTTTQSELSTSFEAGEYTEVWYQSFFHPTTGWNDYVLPTLFYWDGSTTNLLVDIISYQAASTDLFNGNASVYYTETFSLWGPTCLRYQSNIGNPYDATTGTTSYNRANFRFELVPLPNPAVLVAPALGSDQFCNARFDWESGGDYPTGYKLYIGTDGEGTSSPTNIVNGLELGSLTTYYTHTEFLPLNATIYWKVVPYNSSGDALNCPIWYFNTVPLSGELIVGQVNHLISFTDAVNLLNYSGVAETGVTFKCTDITFSGIVPPITASGSANGRIVFEPISEGANPVLDMTGVPSATYGFKLDGADYVTFDNIDVSGPHTTVFGYWLLHGATNNIITNCNIHIPYNPSYDNAAIYSKGANHNCSYTNNVITTNTNFGILNEGISDGIMNNTIISGNVFSYATYRAIETDYSNHTTISSNEITVNPDNTAGFIGISTGSTASLNEISGNLITGSSSSHITAIYTAGAHIHHNQLIDLHCHVAGNVRGIFCMEGDLIIHDNVIKNLTFSGSGDYTVWAITNAGGINTIYNNFIYGLYNPNGNVHPHINAIGGNFTNPSEICHNTIYLDATGSAVDFSAYALSAGLSSRITLKNNIIINLSTPGSTGRVSALSSTTINILASGSDNNIYYCGNPDAAHAIAYIDGVPYSTLDEFKALAGSVEQNSMTELVPFVSYTDPIDVHIRIDMPTLVEGNAIPISWVTHDIDGDLRHTTFPDIGADEGNFMAFMIAAPQNPETSYQNGSCILQWQAVTGATSYRIYHSSDPCAPMPWAVLDTISSLSTQYELTTSESKLFYYVTALVGSQSSELNGN